MIRPILAAVLSLGLCAAAVAAFVATAEPVEAADLPEATGDVVLTITDADGTAVGLDLEGLRSLGVTAFDTSTTWTDGVQTFEGVELAALVAALGLEDGTLTATAINDYAVDIPVSDAVEGGPIVAWSRDGALMSVRDKGPLWIVYPYDSDAAYRTEAIYARSIWQLDRIEVRP